MVPAVVPAIAVPFPFRPTHRPPEARSECEEVSGVIWRPASGVGLASEAPLGADLALGAAIITR